METRAQELVDGTPDTFTPNASIGVIWDGNLFRLSGGQPVPTFLNSTARSDVDTVTDIGLRVDKSYGLQRFTIDLDARQNSYETYNYLNFVAKNGDATWYWAVTPDVTGHLLYTRAQSLNSFTEFTTFARNINTTEITRFDVDDRLGGSIHLGAAAYQTVQDNTQPVFEFDNARINSFEPTITYDSAAGNSFSVYGRIARGHYVDQTLSEIDQVDNAFTEHEAGVRFSYVVDGQTNLFGSLGELSRENSHFASRNFSGLVGQASWQWSFTEKTSTLITASRSIAAYVSTTSSYAVTNRIAIGPQWQATEKILFSVTADDTEYSFQGPITAVTPLRDDHIATLTLQGKWHPLREVNVLGSLAHSTRHSTFPGLEFVDNTVSLTAKFVF